MLGALHSVTHRLKDWVSSLPVGLILVTGAMVANILVFFGYWPAPQWTGLSAVAVLVGVYILRDLYLMLNAGDSYRRRYGR